MDAKAETARVVESDKTHNSKSVSIETDRDGSWHGAECEQWDNGLAVAERVHWKKRLVLA